MQKKKMYMLFDLEPPHKNDFPPEKVAVLAQRLEDYIVLKVCIASRMKMCFVCEWISVLVLCI